MTTRWRGRQIFGGAKDFCSNLLKLTQKICVSKMIDFFWESHKKGLHMSHGEEKIHIKTYFDSQSHSSHNEKVSKHLCPNLRVFFRIFRDFARIFDKSKLLGLRLYPPASPPATPLSKLPSRSSTETPSLLLYMVLNTGTQQIRLKLACSTPVKKIQKLPNNTYTSNAKCLLQFKIFYVR